jgi:hypothetical protein
MTMEQRFAWGLLAALVFLGFVGWLNTGCGYGKGACQIVDLAHYACDTLPIRYLDPGCAAEKKAAGAVDEEIEKACVRSVQVPRNLVQRMAAEEKARQAGQ